MRSRPSALVLVVLTLLFTVVVGVPRPAHAQFGGVVSIVSDIPRTIQQNLDKLTAVIKQRLADVAALAFKNGLQSYLSKVVQENLISIATGNPGQKPLFLTNPGQYFSNVATSSTLDFLDLVSSQNTGQALQGDQTIQVQQIVRSVVEGNTPQAICRQQCEAASQTFLDAITQAQQDLRTAQSVASRDPNQTVPCNVVYTGGPSSEKASQCVTDIQNFLREVQAQSDSDIKACLQSKCANVGPGIILNAKPPAIQGKSNEDVLAQLNKYFIGTGSPIGQIGALYTASVSSGSSAEKAARDTQNGVVGPLLSTISGEIRVPATGTSALLVQSILQSTNAESIHTGSVLADAFQVFSKTLIARLRQNLLQNPCGLNLALCKGPNTSSQLANLLFGAGAPTGIAGAQLQFASIGQVSYLTGDPTKTPIQPADLLQSQGMIDTQFREAINEQITVKEALDKGLLDGGRTFGFDKNGKEPADGYPYRSLVYLRKYRIVPVGWELAALYNRSIAPIDQRQNLNLKQLTQAYDQCGQGLCSNDSNVTCTVGADPVTTQKECGSGTNTCVQQPLSPYCGLVDPNWVLKAPETFCKRQGAGEDIVSRQFVCDDSNGDGKVNCDPGGGDVGHWDITRATDTCSDEQSCIAENDDGSCRAFGYCVVERASFRFDATSCEPQFATCTAYTAPGGQQVAYNANTLDTRNCSAGAAGCQWYCSDQTNGNWTCTQDPKTGQINGNHANFTAAVATCSSGAVGCQQFQRTVDGANLLAGSNAEYYRGTPSDGNPDNFDYDGSGRGWAAVGGANTQAVTGDTPTGSTTALQLSGTGSIQAVTDTGTPLDGRTFTVSLAGRAPSGSCSGTFSVTGGGATATGTATYSNTWTRFATTLAIPAGVSATMLTVRVDTPSCTVLLDDFKLEEGATATAYRDYGADAINLNGSRTQCPASAVGCLSYQSTTGGAAVPGIAKPADQCLPEFVGCRAFTEQAVVNGTDSTLPARQAQNLSIVPSSGQTCSAADVGCEEFTNLDTVAQGGEGREYYKQIQLCVKPGTCSANAAIQCTADSDCGPTGGTCTAPPTATKTYYTWTGSDALGFQLEAFKFKESNLASSPSWPSGPTGPCTNLAFSGVSQSNPACNDTAATYHGCTAADVGVNPDCRDYFDETLKHFYVLEPYVIQVTNDCHPYRNTLDDTSGSTKIYTISPSESLRCSAGAAQCRAYTGSAASNTTTVLSDDFEDGTTTGWTGGTPSNTSISVGGHSMFVSGSAYYDLSSVAVDGATYTVTAWLASADPAGTTLTARITPNTNGTCNPGVTCASAPQTLVAPTVTSTGTTYHWNRYVFGPITLTGGAAGQKLFLASSPTSNFYADNVELTAVVDNVYLINGTPRDCAGNENCSAYTVNGKVVALKSFSGLCQQQFVGCEALENTQNTANPFANNQVFIRGQTVVPGLPADTLETFVNDPRKYCAGSDIGCTAYGRPTIDETGNVVASGYTTVYLKNQPDTYATTYCFQNELWCQAFSSADGTAYFKDPGRQTCTYTTPNGLPAGWYRLGTTLPCSTATVNGVTYQDQVIDQCELRTSSSGLQQYCYRSSPDGTCVPCVARQCPGDQNSCTAYLDPSDPASCNPGCAYSETNGVPNRLDASCRIVTGTCSNNTSVLCGSNADCNVGGGTNTCKPAAVGQVGCRPYYELSSTVKASDCNGTIDATQGCKAFNDTSGGTLNLRSTTVP